MAEVPVAEVPVNSTQNMFKLSKDLGYVTRSATNPVSTFDVNQSFLDGSHSCSWAPFRKKISGQKKQRNYIEFDFHKQILVREIITQGCNDSWVTLYDVEYLKDGEWCQGGKFAGNTDAQTKIVRRTSIITDKLRIFPIVFNNWTSLRIDIAVSEDLTQADNSISDEANKLALADIYNRKMIDMFEQGVYCYRVSVYNTDKDDHIKLQQLKYGTWVKVSISQDGIFQIFCHNGQEVLDQIKAFNPELETTCKEYRSLIIDFFTEQVEELGFLQELKIQILKLQCCQNVKFTQNPGVTVLDTERCYFERLDGIQNWKQLQELYLSGNRLENIDYFTGLTNLTQLFLKDNYITNIDSLAGMKNMIYLDLSKNKITNIDSLAGMTQLIDLRISENLISDIDALSGLINLTTLNLAKNQIFKIDSIKYLQNVSELTLTYNQIQNIDTLKNLTNILVLLLGNNNISNIDVLATLSGINELFLQSNKISDIQPLKDLQNLTFLTIARNQIDNLEALSSLFRLSILNVTDNKITNIEPLKDLVGLEILNLSSNFIKDFSVLGNHPNFAKYQLQDQK
ncbi:leucine-rich_repeat domain-containing protein [Hexamita inflata]|uniref:Leucine-rich repeat domain-containing protein n=1 Tax=Hexamita inflata TaxID=28002 RepID=A0AA86UWX1_9EUKA|nr:leucine-rich repeat domain-containing protein [Hexamita inflata]